MQQEAAGDAIYLEVSPSPCLPCQSFLKSLYPFIPTIQSQGSFHHISVMSARSQLYRCASNSQCSSPMMFAQSQGGPLPAGWSGWNSFGILFRCSPADLQLLLSLLSYLLGPCIKLAGETWTEGSFLGEFHYPHHYENSDISCNNQIEKSDNRMECL